jgi:hypothetical protein
MKKFLLILPISILLFSGCNSSSGNAELRVKAMCDCVQEVVDLSGLNALNIEDKLNEIDKNSDKEIKFSKCLFGVFEQMSKDLDELKQEEKKTYTKNFMKASIDCECTDKVMDLIPFDMLKVTLPLMKSEMERMISRKERNKSDYENTTSAADDYLNELSDTDAGSYDDYQKELDKAMKDAEKAIQELNEEL